MWGLNSIQRDDIEPESGRQFGEGGIHPAPHRLHPRVNFEKYFFGKTSFFCNFRNKNWKNCSPFISKNKFTPPP